MNLYPGDSIEVGATRTSAAAALPIAPVTITVPKLAPNTVVTSTACSVERPAPMRLDPADFTDAQAVRAAVAGWCREDLFALGSVFMAEGDRLTERDLVALLRWLCEPGGPDDPESPVERVEFVTQAYDDGVTWDDETIHFHRADGTVEEYEWPEDYHLDADWQEKQERYVELLHDYSRATPPADGAHLIVDLRTGEFDISGKWST